MKNHVLSRSRQVPKDSVTLTTAAAVTVMMVKFSLCRSKGKLLQANRPRQRYLHLAILARSYLLNSTMSQIKCVPTSWNNAHDVFDQQFANKSTLKVPTEKPRPKGQRFAEDSSSSDGDDDPPRDLKKQRKTTAKQSSQPSTSKVLH